MSDREAMKEALRILTKPESGDLRWQVTDACDILRARLAAPRPEPVLAKDWMKITLQVNRGDRVFQVQRLLHLKEIKQSHFPLVEVTLDTVWKELDAAREASAAPASAAVDASTAPEDKT